MESSQCIGCGQCEKACPQHLPIREYLKDAAEKFETGNEFPVRS
nr:4Fe-4S binding protein [uncultured Anaerostipes sp.]